MELSMPETPLQYTSYVKTWIVFSPKRGMVIAPWILGMICPQGFPFWDEPLCRSSNGFLDLFGLTTTTRKPPNFTWKHRWKQISHDVRSCAGAMVRNYGMKYELLRAGSVYYPHLTFPSVQSYSSC